jgi:hypothetical protein
MKFVLRSFLALLGLLSCYAAAYLALVVPGAVGQIVLTQGTQFLATRTAQYRVGGEYAAALFGPAHHLDSTVLRRGVWLVESANPFR